MNCQICGTEFKNKSALIPHEKSCLRITDNIEDIKKSYLIDGYSISKLSKEYKIGKDTLLKILGKLGIKRNLSQSAKLARKLYPNNYFHTEESKEKMRIKRLEFMRNNPHKTAWRLSNLSYPEKLFLNGLENRGLDKSYRIIREFSIFPYFIDFAFVDFYVAIEIDGSQHNLEERRISDLKKEELLISNGWKLIRFTENEIKTNLDNCIDIVIDICEDRDFYGDITKFGIFSSVQKKHCKKCDKEICRKSELCNGCASVEFGLSQRRVERPPYEQLLDEILNLGYVGTGKKYGVSDNSIRQWIKNYKKHLDI
jgi:very-short-patch-repair endonuclease